MILEHIYRETFEGCLIERKMQLSTISFDIPSPLSFKISFYFTIRSYNGTKTIAFCACASKMPGQILYIAQKHL